MLNSDLLHEMLEEIENTIFDNEESFIEEFFPDVGCGDLLNFYFSSVRHKAVLLLDCGAQVNFYVDIDRFNKWYKDVAD